MKVRGGGGGRIPYQRKGRHTLCAKERSHSVPERGGIFCVRAGGGGGG